MAKKGIQISLEDIDLDLDSFDVKEYVREVRRKEELNKKRKNQPWIYDIVQVLWMSQSYLSMDQLTKAVWKSRQMSGLPMPERFSETVQSALNRYTSQSSQFRGGTDDDLFYSPKGKGSGTWAVHRDRAAKWLKSKKLS